MIARAARALALLLGCACSSSEPAAGPTPVVDAGESDVASPIDANLGGDAPESGTGDSANVADTGPVGGDRPVVVHVPPGYMPGVPAPLVIMLHGYTASGAIEESYLGLTAVSDERGFLYAYPDGTKDALGNGFWNATAACCGTGPRTVDDSAYLSGLIVDIQARYSVDAKKIFFVGHSNGGFMSYRMACDHSDQVAAMASLAGAMFDDVADCKATAPVSILQIHGTADTVIAYTGSAIQGNAYPSAETTVLDWATLDGCSTPPDTSAAPLDLEATLPGDESAVTKYGSGCRPGGHAELWTIQGGTHIPTLSASFSRKVVDFLLAHPKP